jgi:Heavy-metal resistance
MKKLLFVLVLAVAAACVTYSFHFRQKAAPDETEQQWLKREFALSDAQLATIERLEREYRPVCDGHCADYMAAHSRLEALVAKNAAWRPEMGQAMETLYRTQMECQRDMLKHAYEVSAVMAPDQAQRYLAMILGKLSLTPPDEMQRSTR